ncbi:hypothetical protein ACFE04_007700 [Oxalis oulophora]
MESLADMELRVLAYVSSTAGSRQIRPSEIIMYGILFLAFATGPTGCFKFMKKKASKNETNPEAENMTMGALSVNLFCKNSPLSWIMRLTVALDIAKAMESIHRLATMDFIHQELSSSNIVLDGNFRAIVDFGLVPDEAEAVATSKSIYLAPECKGGEVITSKATVYSFGVVLLEILTGLSAFDERLNLVDLFRQIIRSEEQLKATMDPALRGNEKNVESMLNVARLAVDCTSEDPNARPEMDSVVRRLGPLDLKAKLDEERLNGSNSKSDNVPDVFKHLLYGECLSAGSINSGIKNEKGSSSLS